MIWRGSQERQHEVSQYLEVRVVLVNTFHAHECSIPVPLITHANLHHGHLTSNLGCIHNQELGVSILEMNMPVRVVT